MRASLSLLSLILAPLAIAQRPLPALHDGTVLDEKAEFRQDGPLRIAGHIKLKGITLDLRGPITVAPGADLELDDVQIKVSDPSGSANGTSSLHCEGPAKISIRHSSMQAQGSAHPIWALKGELSVDDFQTTNAEFHLDHVEAKLNDFAIFELEISKASHVTGRHLRLVFLSTHTGDAEEVNFSDIPAGKSFSQKLQMGSQATADLTDTTIKLFLLYVHGRSHASLKQIGRAQLAFFPACRGHLKLPQGMVGAGEKPVVVPEAGASDCAFRFQMQNVNADTWDVYAGGEADLTFSDSVIDELTANGHAQVKVTNSDIYADWLSLGGNAHLLVDHSTVGAQRLAAERPDLATSQVRAHGQSQATFDDVTFDCGVLAGDDASITIRNPVKSPAYLRRAGRAKIKTEPALPIENVDEEKH
ncbi:MAG TPA: hypothetical protein VF133_18220 [Terriglobales bacterium]